MGLFRDFKEGLSDTREDVMVNTLDGEGADTDLSSLSASFTRELEELEEREELDEREEKEIESEVAEAELVVEDELENSADAIEYDVQDEDLIADETAVITAGLTVSGDLDSIGSIDVFGTVTGNISCRGKLNVSGMVYGDSKANDMFANNAKIDGNIDVNGAVKIGQGTVIVGNISATSAVIAGAVKGDIDVKGPVVVDSTAVIVGDIKSRTVQINNGATIDGHCSQCYAEVNTETLFDIKPKNKNNK